MTSLFASLSRLDWTIYASWIGVAAILCIPAQHKSAIRVVALLSALAGSAVAVYCLFAYRVADAVTLADSFKQFEVRIDWIPSLGISYHLGADGISLPLIALNGIVAVAGVLFSWNVEERTKEFFAFFLALISGVYGVFLSLDVFLLFAFYELAIIPKYFLIVIWGSTQKEYSAMKLVMYSFVGSALVFIGILAMFFGGDASSFDLFALREARFSTEFQFWCFPLVFFGFAVLAGIWPFHTWAPTGHAAAPTAASMLLAGVVMKLGAYGCLRVAMLLMPEGLTAHGGFWQWCIAILAVIGIVYGAGVALVQKDFKLVVGYSSVSHMGFVLLGLVTLNTIGLDGAVLQMFSHGIVASLLFAVVGRMVYDRTHTRKFSELSPMRLATKMPFVATVFTVGGLASMGLPGFSGFVAELHVLMGAWEVYPWAVILSGAGILVTMAYTFRALHQGFFGGLPLTFIVDDHVQPYFRVTVQEKTAALLLVAMLVIVGVYPSIILDMIDHSVQLMLSGMGGNTR